VCYSACKTFRKLINEAESKEKANVKEFWSNIKMVTDVTEIMLHNAALTASEKIVSA
jgi:hypothetical protein